MAKKFDFDWKNFLLQKGERVGLYAALGIMGLMLAFGLFWPGSGIFSGSSSANARALADLNQAASNALANNKPTGADAEDTVTDPKYKQAGDLELASVSRPSTGYFAPFEREETRRRRPIIDKPDEWQSTIVLAALDLEPPELQLGPGLGQRIEVQGLPELF